MKFALWKEKTASTGLSVGLVKRYSSAATGSEESSASPGMKGLQPVSPCPAGSWVAQPHRAKGSAPRSAPRRSVAGRSSCRAAVARADDDRSPRETAACVGDRPLQDAGEILPLALDAERGKAERFVEDLGLVAQRDVREAPAPSRHTMPAPMPPIGKAIRSRFSPV